MKRPKSGRSSASGYSANSSLKSGRPMTAQSRGMDNFSPGRGIQFGADTPMSKTEKTKNI